MLLPRRYCGALRLSACLAAVLVLSNPIVLGDLSINTEGKSSRRTDSSDSTKQLLPRHVPCDWPAIAKKTCEPIKPGDGHCTQAAKKGEQLLTMLKSTDTSPSQFGNVEDLTKHGYTTEVQVNQGEELSATLLSALEQLAIPIEAEGWTFYNTKHLQSSTLGTEVYPATRSYFQNFANLEHGIIIADNNRGPHYMNAQAKQPASHIVPLKQWSDVFFLAWRDSGTSANVRKLAHVFRDNISNQATIEVMRSIIGKDNLDASDMWPGHQISYPDVRLKAAVGTPNGNGVAWLAAQHRAELGTKVIDQVNIFNCGTEDYGTWCMYLHLSDASSLSKRSVQILSRVVRCNWDTVATQASQPILPGDDHCTKAAKKGEQLLLLMSKCNAAPSQWTSYSDLALYGYNSQAKTGTEVVDTLHAALEKLQIPSTPSDWTRFTQLHERESRPVKQRYTATEARFTNSVNYKYGVIIAEDNFGPNFWNNLRATPRPQNRIVPLKQWSDVLFLQWRETAEAQPGGAGSLRKLEHVLRDAVGNPDTKKLMKSIIGKDKLDKEDTWPGYEYKWPDARLKAAVGSPNGNGIAWLVAQHKAEIGNKTVDQVNIFNCGGGHLPKWCLYFHLKDVPATAAEGEGSEDVLMGG